MARVIVLTADAGARATWRHELERRGWEVTEVGDIKAAVDVAIRLQPHAIVTAVQLPGVTGYHFVRTLRGVVDHDIKVIGVGECPPDVGFDRCFHSATDFDPVHLAIELVGDDPDDRVRTREMKPLVS